MQRLFAAGVVDSDNIPHAYFHQAQSQAITKLRRSGLDPKRRSEKLKAFTIEEKFDFHTN